MTRWADPSFSTYAPGDQQYRDNWDATFGGRSPGEATSELHYGCVNCTTPIAETGLCETCSRADTIGHQRGVEEGKRLAVSDRPSVDHVHGWQMRRGQDVVACPGCSFEMHVDHSCPGETPDAPDYYACPECGYGSRTGREGSKVSDSSCADPRLAEEIDRKNDWKRHVLGEPQAATPSSSDELALLRALAAAVGQLVRANDPNGNENPRPDIAWRDVRRAYSAVEPFTSDGGRK